MVGDLGLLGALCLYGCTLQVCRVWQFGLVLFGGGLGLLWFSWFR